MMSDVTSESNTAWLTDLRILVRGFNWCTVHATSSVSCHHPTLFACTLLCTFYWKNLEFLSSLPGVHNQYVAIIRPRVAIKVWFGSKVELEYRFFRDGVGVRSPKFSNPGVSPTENKDSTSPIWRTLSWTYVEICQWAFTQGTEQNTPLQFCWTTSHITCCLYVVQCLLTSLRTRSQKHCKWLRHYL